jgi:hypothetical protein
MENKASYAFLPPAIVSKSELTSSDRVDDGMEEISLCGALLAL